jgi:hypothetical protein
MPSRVIAPRPWRLTKRVLEAKHKEVISKCSIRLKIEAGRGGRPQTYIEYFEDWTPRPNTEIELEGRF